MYVGLCLKIETPQQVAIRRDVVDIKELLVHKVRSTDYLVTMVSVRGKDSESRTQITTS